MILLQQIQMLTKMIVSMMNPQRNHWTI